MRILVTGSRDWSTYDVVHYALSDHTYGQDRSQVTVVHGNARGLDQLAEKAALELGMQVESHPADWARYGKGAGMRRNAEMVKLGADVCLAFPKNNSKGTWGCMTLARSAGIIVFNYGAIEP